MALRFRLPVLLATALVALLAVSSASASEIVTRNAENVSLKVESKGRAVIYYTAGGKRFHPVFWGAVNARPPSRTRAQVEFKRDYSGGYMRLGTPLWKNIKNVCRPYTGPPLAWYVAGCTAPDGSHWALQSWQRRLPNLGMTPWLASQRVWELHLSHFTGEPAVLEMYTDYIYWGGLFHHLFGRLTYKGEPVYGYENTGAGNPTDSYGRNIYVDTLDSRYGRGWKRENGFLSHRFGGTFCYGFYPHDRYSFFPAGPRRPRGNGDAYRATVIGPGVSPVAFWSGAGLPEWTNSPEQNELEERMTRISSSMMAKDKKCQRL
ncbi:MAG: hypothetical protein ACR2L0_00825 [Gaiellaceae bacterium]